MRFIVFFLSFALFSAAAHAACTSPAGQASQTRYDMGANKMYYCNNAAWVEMGAPVGAVMNNKWCRGTGTQIVCDQNAPTGDTLAGLSCVEGAIVVMGASGWTCGFASGSDCATGPVGTVCASDGAFYIGDIGGARIYARATDSSPSVQWRTSNTDTPGTESTTAGPANTNAMISAGSHPAATLCRSHGLQWYVPAKDELALIWTNSTIQGGALNLAAMGIERKNSPYWYWSSTQRSYDAAYVQRFTDGDQSYSGKGASSRVRCVRR